MNGLLERRNGSGAHYDLMVIDAGQGESRSRALSCGRAGESRWVGSATRPACSYSALGAGLESTASSYARALSPLVQRGTRHVGSQRCRVNSLEPLPRDQ